MFLGGNPMLIEDAKPQLDVAKVDSICSELKTYINIKQYTDYNYCSFIFALLRESALEPTTKSLAFHFHFISMVVPSSKALSKCYGLVVLNGDKTFLHADY